MRRETKWLVVYPNERWEWEATRPKALKCFRAIAKAYGGGTTHFGPRFVYEVPMDEAAGAKIALECAGFNVPYEYVTSQLARALAETTLPFSVHKALEALEEADAEALDTWPADQA